MNHRLRHPVLRRHVDSGGRHRLPGVRIRSYPGAAEDSDDAGADHDRRRGLPHVPRSGVFESLFKSNLWIWALGWLFHVGLALVLLRHLRYFTEPVNFIIAFIQPFGMYAGFAMAAGLAGLWARRFLVERIRYISTPSDHLMLALLLGIAGTGLLMKFVMHTDVVAVKTFFLGLMVFEINPLPVHPGLYLHLGMVVLLMIIFPVSKLLHAPGLFFSPTRNQVDNPRETRHLAPWAAKFEAKN
jgi:nitrate reductase gamma subunit